MTVQAFQLAFFVAFWFWVFQVCGVVLFISTRKALKQFFQSRMIKNGQLRCSSFFHCHCEKVGPHEVHVSETNEVVWR